MSTAGTGLEYKDGRERRVDVMDDEGQKRKLGLNVQAEKDDEKKRRELKVVDS
jgi:hypothetical protein